MKALVVSFCLLPLCQLLAAESTTTLGFDAVHLNNGEHVLIEDGYGGLLWQNLGIINGTVRPDTEGYHNGVVSPDNVAFNLSGNPATISSPRAFRLESAALTSASAEGQRLHIQAFNRDSKVLDTNVVLSAAKPTLMDFGSIEVQRINFLPPPSTFFVIDDLKVSGQTSIAEFDSLSPGTSHVPIPNGYRGLDWKNWAVIDGSKRPATEGYRTGIVSPDNAAFNQQGDVAEIRSADPFTLSSGRFTAAFVDGMSLRVRGFNDGSLVFDQTHSLRTTGPTALAFSRSEVDRVLFEPSPSTQFALDDLKFLPPTTNHLATVDLGTVRVDQVVHRFTSSPYADPGSPLRSGVSDFMISPFGTGQQVLPGKSVNFDQTDRFELKVSAPPGKKFVVRPPANRSVRMTGTLTWQGIDPLRNGPTRIGTVQVAFGDIEGVAPSFSGSQSGLSDLHNFFGFTSIESAAFSNELAFTSMTLRAKVPSIGTGTGTIAYTPKNVSLAIGYTVDAADDPGSFVTLESADTPVTSEPVRFSIRTSEVTLSWQSNIGSRYQVQTKNSFDDPEWVEVGPARDGTGGIMEQAEPVGDPTRMYRVVELK